MPHQYDGAHDPELEPLTVANLIEILHMYDPQAEVRIMQSYGLRARLTDIIWRIPYLSLWLTRYNMDTYPTKEVAGIYSDGKTVDIA